MKMVFLYYDNPKMLRMQIDCWNSYIGKLNNPPEVLLVDDGSPNTSAIDVVQKHACKISIKVFRIKEDISWNCSGARNLGCINATGWIYISDIDMLLEKDAAKVFFESHRLNKKCFYIPQRALFHNSKSLKRSFSCLLFHKEAYLATGGYDEDYAGYYGIEDYDFLKRLQQKVSCVPRDDVLIKAVLPELVADACTTGKQRYGNRNYKLFQRKLAAGLRAPKNPLRFSWERVL